MSQHTSGSNGRGPTKTRVGVVLGGRSSEREISLETGRHIFHTLDRSRYEPAAIYMDRRGRLWHIGLSLLVQNTTRDIEERLTADATPLPYQGLPDLVDVAFIALHGKYGEDGCFQGLLELLDVPYTGSGVLGSALGMDKVVQRRLLAAAGVDVPRHVALGEADWAADRDAAVSEVEDALGYPCVVKPAREGCSTGLAVAADRGTLTTAVDAALEWDATALVEELLRGTEVTVTVLDGDPPRAFAPTETPPQAEFLTIEEKFLPGHGQNITPARLDTGVSTRVTDVAARAFSSLGLRIYARIDMYVTDDGRVVVGEPNTLPGATPSSTVFLGPMEEGIAPRELLTEIVEGSLAAHRGKKGPLD